MLLLFRVNHYSRQSIGLASMTGCLRAVAISSCVFGWSLVGVASLLLFVDKAIAAEWYASSRLEQQFEIDDNVGLNTRSDQQVSAWGSTSSVVANLGGRTPNLSVRLDSVLDFTVFPNENSLNSDDQYVALGGDYRTERSLFGLDGEFIRDTTRTSDVDDTGVFILDNDRRELYRIGPSWSYLASPLDTVNVSADYTNVHYPSSRTALRDYEQISGTVGWTHALTPRTQFLTSLSTSYYDSNASGSLESTVFQALVGGSHDFSERTRITALVGPQIVSQDIRGKPSCTVNVNPCPQGFTERFTDKNTDVGYAADAGISFQASERTSFEGQYTRTAEPSTSTGVLLERNNFRAYYRYEALERVAIDAAARYIMQDTLATGGETETRHFVSVEPGVRWRITEDLNLRCFYRFRWQKFDGDGGSGSSNAAFARITYELPELSTSN